MCVYVHVGVLAVVHYEALFELVCMSVCKYVSVYVYVCMCLSACSGTL